MSKTTDAAIKEQNNLKSERELVVNVLEAAKRVAELRDRQIESLSNMNIMQLKINKYQIRFTICSLISIFLLASAYFYIRCWGGRSWNYKLGSDGFLVSEPFYSILVT